MRFVCLLLLFSFTLAAEIVPGKFILELSAGPPAKDGARSARVLESQVRAACAQRKARVTASVDTVLNALMVDADSEAQLRGIPGVRRIYPVKLLYKSLDHALPLMRIPEAWQMLGGASNAGSGMRIGIIDTGIDPFHAAFQDTSLTPPDGFPRFSSDSNREITNNKIIVARSYDDSSAMDRVGHGTSVAMIAAGVPVTGPRNLSLAGVAPKAFLGAYRANVGSGDTFRTDVILRAIDDAVKDGMDVINMSLGAPGVSLAEDEVITVAINRAVEAGVIVVTAAGNAGPDPVTVGNTGAVPNAISVGSTNNDRIPVSPMLAIPSEQVTFLAAAASNSSGASSVRGMLRDAGLACGPLSGINGAIALIQRGDCTFESKLNNAADAGAVAAVVYNNQAEPARINMEVGAARLRGLFLSQPDGEAVKQRLAANPNVEYLMLFSDFAPSDPDVVSDFSGRGPTLDLEIKPDLVAVGGAVITATNGTEAGRPETSGYILSAGTSLSAPAVAGAAAVLKAARPGLRVSQYRSLIINSTTRFPANRDEIRVQQTGAGMLNLSGALTSNTVLSPVSLSFGEYRGQSVTRELTIFNLGRSAETFQISLLTADSVQPRLSTDNLTVESGDSATINLELNTPSPGAGEYQGFLEISGSSGTVSRVPYWTAVRSRVPSRISVADQPFAANTGGTAQVLFRVLDSGGFFLLEPNAEMNVVSGGGSVTSVGQLGAQYPGLYLARVRLGSEPGTNVFRIRAAGAEREVRIVGER